MQYLDEEFDLTSQKIKTLEKELDSIREILHHTVESLKETQRYLMKLAYSQSDLTRKVSTWPFISVPSEKDKGDEL